MRSYDMEADLAYIPDSDEVRIERLRDPDTGSSITVSVPREDLLRALDQMIWEGMSARYRHRDETRIMLFGIIQGGRQ